MTSRALRFLFVTGDRFPPFRPDVEVLFGKEFLRRGHEIDWIMQAAKPDSDTGLLEWRGSRVWVARTKPGKSRASRVAKHLLNLGNELRAVRLLSRERYDFVQIKDKFLIATIVLIAAKLKHIPFFFWLSYPYPEASLLKAKTPEAKYPWFYRLRGWAFKVILYRIICRFCDHVFVQSDEMKRSMTIQGVAASKMTPVPMGVEMEAYPLPGPQAEGDPIVLYLGSLGRARRLEFLVDAFLIVLESFPRARLVFVGEGEEPEDRPYLQAYVARAGLADQVAFTGFLARAEATRHIAAARVCVSPITPTPVYDVASPTKILEYMAAGKAVVANDQPDQRLVLEQSRAGLCTPYSVPAFAAALVEILRDPNRAADMGARGRRYVEEHRSYAAIASFVERRYSELLAGSRSRERPTVAS